MNKQQKAILKENEPRRETPIEYYCAFFIVVIVTSVLAVLNF
jgi:hypothetical protein